MKLKINGFLELKICEPCHFYTFLEAVCEKLQTFSFNKVHQEMCNKTQNCTNTPVWHDCVNFPLNAVRLIFFADVFGLLGFTPQFPFACIRVTLLIVCNYLFIIMALTALY